VPNGLVDSRDLIAFERKRNRPGRSKDGHLFFMPRAALLEMLSRTGFTPERTYTYGIRRGLRTLGLYPRWKRWERAYESKPRSHADQPGQPAGAAPHAPNIALAAEKRRPAWYYHYRHLQSRVKRLPGLHDVGLDFLIYAR
jgi:hypothetical protein